MFGKLRPPPTPPDCLERSPAKIIKDDPLSVYESTLLKLKQGSRLDNSSETEVENLTSSLVCSDTHRETQEVTLCSSMAIDSGSGQCEQLKKKNPSVLSMFCRYKNLAQAQNSVSQCDRD